MRKIAIISLVMYILSISQLFGMQERDAASPSIRFLSFNIRREGKEEKSERLWPSRLPLVQNILDVLKPDIIGFQEPNEKQVEDLHNLLGQFDYFGEARGTSWWGLGDSEYNPIFYNKEKFTLLASGTFKINDIKGWFGWMPWLAVQTGWLPRICTWGRFKDNNTDKEFYVYNAHFDHMYKQAQITCARSVMEHIRQRACDLPIIVMGDFNTPFTDEVQKIFSNFSHAKPFADITFGPRETSTGWENSKLQWIDHILVKKKQASHVLQFGVIENKPDEYPSDHRPIMADVVL